MDNNIFNLDFPGSLFIYVFDEYFNGSETKGFSE